MYFGRGFKIPSPPRIHLGKDFKVGTAAPAVAATGAAITAATSFNIAAIAAKAKAVPDSRF